jgi:tight adherence protein B
MSPLVIRVFVLIAIFAAVFLVSEQLIRLMRQSRKGSVAINKRLRMIEGGADREHITSRLRKSQPDTFRDVPGIIGRAGRALERAVVASGVALPPHQIILAMAVATGSITALVILGAAFAGYAVKLGVVELALVVGLALGFGVPMLFLQRKANNRRKRMQEQFPVALDIFVRGLKSGHPISSALDLLTKEMEDPIGSEFGLVVDSVSYGSDLREALQSMADRWGIEDIQMFVVSLSVQNETGGNLAEILSNLSTVIRDRASMYMKVRALSSEGRMTATVLTALPVLTIGGLFMLSPKFYLDVAEDPYFIPGFLGLVVMYFIGFFTIRNMVDLKV